MRKSLTINNTRIEQHVSSCRREHHSENDVSTFKHWNDALAKARAPSATHKDHHYWKLCSRLHEDTYFETHALVEARTSFTRKALQYMLELMGGMQLRNWKPMWKQKPLAKPMKTKGVQVWRQLGHEQVYGMQLETTLIAKAICKTIEKTKAIQVWRPLG